MATAQRLDSAEDAGRHMGREAVDAGEITASTDADSLHSIALRRASKGTLNCGLTYNFEGDRACFVAFYYGFTAFALYWRKDNSVQIPR